MDSSHVMMNTPSISSAPVTSFASVRLNRFQFQSSPNTIFRCPARAFPLWWRKRPVVAFSVRASGRGKWDSPSPHQILGVPPSASIDEIKKAYRRLALKYHPDVNKEADAQNKFTRIKHAYNTILSTKSGNHKSGFSSSQSQREATQKEAQEEFYGFGDFLRDAQEEYRNWEAAKQEKPKSLWQELADIGEEFVEFLEKELNISDSDGETATVNKETKPETPVESTIDEIEAALARLKSELGI